MAAYTAAAIAVVGAGVQIYGQIKSSKAQAAAEKQNAAFYEEQAQFAQKAGDRELQIYQDQADQFFGNQKSGFAKGGVELSGSPLLALADTKLKESKEEAAIQFDTAAKVREASLKGGFADTTANSISSSTKYQVAGTSLTALSSVASNYKKGSA